MSKKADNIMSNKEGSDESSLPEPSLARDTYENRPTGAPQPRGARFGGEAGGGGVRRERGAAGSRAGFFERTAQFLRDVRAEMRRVSWPSFDEVKNTTLITLVAVIFFAIYLYAVDRGLGFLISQLERLINWLTGAA